ncbi:hypothetical protein ACHQM5_023544 [Ranunculus cassubicifolius]
MPQCLHANRQFICCSPKNGQQIIGIPLQMLSSVEFHPLCVKNPPIEGWLSTCSCGHQLTNKPLRLITAKKSDESMAESPETRSGLMTHKNACLLLARPQANSIICSGVTTVILPKFT